MSKRADRSRKSRTIHTNANTARMPVESEIPPTADISRRPWILGSLNRPVFWFSVAYLAALIGFSFHYLSASLRRTWFYNSDEYIVVAEVIRFSNLDFHQHFVDMPGTPFMMVVAAVWGVFARLALLNKPFIHEINTYTFHHIEWVFWLTRFATLFFHAISLVLTFLVAGKVLNRAAACMAALLLMMNPTYASYSSLVRVESMSMCLVLAGVLVLYFGLEERPELLDRMPGWEDPVLWSGVLAGIGAGARLHSVFASAPLLWLILVLDRKTARAAYPKWVRTVAWFSVPLIVAGGTAFAVFAHSRTTFPHAYSLLSNASAAVVGLVVVLVCLYWIRAARPLVLRLAPASVMKLALGFAAGGLIGFPTIITQSTAFLESMEMYSSSYIDWYRTTWPVAQNVKWYLSFYFHAAAPDTIVVYLMTGGAALILLLRDRRPLPYLLTAAVFFVSRPINLQAAAHHLILWLPAYAIVCSYPVALGYSLWKGRVPWWALNAAFAIVLLAVAAQLTNGPQEANYGARTAEGRLANVGRATTWMHEHLAEHESTASAYYCFNADVFYTWAAGMDLPVPKDLFVYGRHRIWWGHRGELAGIAGLACITKADIEPIRRGLPLQRVSEAADPYHDAAFQQVASFGKGEDEVDVFHFDFRGMR